MNYRWDIVSNCVRVGRIFRVLEKKGIIPADAKERDGPMDGLLRKRRDGMEGRGRGKGKGRVNREANGRTKREAKGRAQRAAMDGRGETEWEGG